jgi:hypothetical protein
MNERIEALADKASNDINMVGYHNIPDEFKQKFAELIVRECSRVAKLKIGHNKVCDAIEQHFGLDK